MQTPCAAPGASGLGAPQLLRLGLSQPLPRRPAFVSPAHLIAALVQRTARLPSSAFATLIHVSNMIRESTVAGVHPLHGR